VLICSSNTDIIGRLF